jgi:hypothetical protein
MDEKYDFLLNKPLAKKLVQRTVAQVLDFPCCKKKSWAYITLELDRVNLFQVTCKQCRAVWMLEVRPREPKTPFKVNLIHPVRWYVDTDYGVPPCKHIPARVITPWKP